MHALRAGTYDDAYAGFVWSIPDSLNLGVAILDAPALQSPDAIAVIDGVTGQTQSFADLAHEAARLTGALMALGACKGDRVAVIAPQSPRTIIVQAAIFRAGLISVPLSERYGRDALAHRLGDSGARFAFVSVVGMGHLGPLLNDLPELEHLITLDGPAERAVSFDALMKKKGEVVSAVDTGGDDPCLMIYTSGTTGPAKGAVHGHRVLAGHMPGFLFSHDGRVSGTSQGGGANKVGDVFYTPADWAWAGGLLNLLFPALSLGLPVVAYSDPKGFVPADVVAMMAKNQVSHAFLPPTALKLMRAALAPEVIKSVGLRSVMSAGEALGKETYLWAQQAFGFSVSEAYGQTECNLVIGSSAAYGTMRAGATGKPVPGHDVRIVREDGSETGEDEAGEIAIGMPDPVSFLGYWRGEDATARKYIIAPDATQLLMTGDMAMRDGDGYIWFIGRDDDVITSSGHRIGPGEIEDSLTGHQAVSMAAVVGVPDDLRTQIVRAFVVLREGYEPSDALADELRTHVRTHLAAHEYPREVRFVDALPMTTTGKIIRRLLKDQD